MVSAAAVWLALIFTWAPSAAQERPTTWTGRDSAGIRIVANRSPVWGDDEVWRLADAPRLVIAEDPSDPAGLWGQIRTTFLWEDGRVGVLAAEAPHLRVYGGDGRELFRAGRTGEGPGELRLPIWAGPMGDSASVYDRRAGAFSVYGPDGTYVRRAAPPTEFRGEATEVLASDGARGWVMVRNLPVLDPAHGGEVRSTAPRLVVVVSPDGVVVDTLGSVETLITFVVQDALWGKYRHLAITDRLTGSDLGLHAIVPDRYEIRSYEDGGLTRVVRAPIRGLRELTEAHLGFVRAQWGAVAERFIERDREYGRLVPPPAVHVLGAEDGSLWVRRADDGPLADRRMWDVFDPTGVWQGTVETPGAFTIHEVHEDEVLGIWLDELDVPSVRLYRIERGG